MYVLTVVSRDTSRSAVKGGFQMTILGPLNTKVGKMEIRPPTLWCPLQITGSILNTTLLVLFQIAASSDGLLNGQHRDFWVAPRSHGTSQGILANGNNEETGGSDCRHQRQGGNCSSQGTKDVTLEKPTVYPNSGSDVINVTLPDGTRPTGKVSFIH